MFLLYVTQQYIYFILFLFFMVSCIYCSVLVKSIMYE